LTHGCPVQTSRTTRYRKLLGICSFHVMAGMKPAMTADDGGTACGHNRHYKTGQPYRLADRFADAAG
jgi:hypothetical protein